MASTLPVYCHLALQIVHRRSTLLYHSLPTIILPHSIFFSFILSSSNSFCRKWDWFGRFSDHGKPKCCQGLGRGVCFTFNDCSICFGCLCLFLLFYFFILCSCSLSVIWTFLTHQPSPISPMDGGTLMVT